MQPNYKIHAIKCLSAVLALTCGLAFAQQGPIPGTPKVDSPQGGGGGVGISIDVGSVINLLKNLKKKDDPQNDEIERSAKDQFQQGRPSMTLEQVSQKLRAASARDVRRSQLTTGGSARAGQRGTPQTESCKLNGNFETAGLSSWSGADNGSVVSIRDNSTRFIISALGINSGVISADTAHQTIVSPGNDPTLGALLQQVRPGGGGSSVRIGNTSVNYGAELLAKSFKVSAADSIVGFSYAVVLQNPSGHAANRQPSFSVRVLDASGADITNNIPGGRVRLAPSSTPNVLEADSNNPFFQTYIVPNTVDLISGESQKIVYKDWTCSEINLSDMVGQDVTIEFITIDCGLGGHYAYAYIDDFCTTCGAGPEGSIKLAESDKCGVGKVCVDVTVPKAGTQTGQATASLDIWQNGVKLTTYTSAVMTADGKMCFPIDPSTIPGLDKTKGFDYSAKADLKIGSYVLPTKLLGAGPDGLQPGRNNDYELACTVQPPACGTPGAPPCPTCGQAGQPVCPPCGQPGQALCVETCLAVDNKAPTARNKTTVNNNTKVTK